MIRVVKNMNEFEIAKIVSFDQDLPIFVTHGKKF
jgi:hypothetical protein